MMDNGVRGKRKSTKKPPNDARVPLTRIKHGLSLDTNEARPEEKSSGLAIS